MAELTVAVAELESAQEDAEFTLEEERAATAEAQAERDTAVAERR